MVRITQECKAGFEPVSGSAGEESVDCTDAARVAPALLAAGQAPGYSLAGAAWGIFAISIWAGWFISTRFNVTSNLRAVDLIALRFGVTALILLPLAIRLHLGAGAVTWKNGAALFAGSGVIYSLCATAGVQFAPAAEAAALTPGVMPMATALLSVLFFGERVTKNQIFGFAFILLGVIVIAGWAIAASGGGEWAGHVLFLTAAFLFAGYTIALKKSALSGLKATALVSFWSSVVYLPIYYFALHPRIFDMAPAELIVPAFYQGVLTNIVSLAAYARAVEKLGASRASAFAALIPAVTAGLSILILGEYPPLQDWPGIAAVSVGVYLASGAPMPWGRGSAGQASPVSKAN